MLHAMDPGAVASLAAARSCGQLIIGVVFAAHYALIGIATAAIVNLLGSPQTAIALLPLHARTAQYVGCGLIAATAGTIIATWAGPPASSSRPARCSWRSRACNGM